MLADHVLVDRLDDPVGVLDRFGEGGRALEVVQPALHHAFGRATERDQRAGPPTPFARGGMAVLCVRIEDRARPAGGRAQGRPPDADVAGADHRHFPRNRHAIASSASAPAGSTRSNSSRRAVGGWTSMATRANDPFGSSFVRPRACPSSRSTEIRKSLNVRTSGWMRYAIASTSLMTAPSSPSRCLWNST